ncbi:hypothetical protein, partial [Amycolatopsis magusensis]
MSAPQPPDQPWGGGQPSQGPPSGPNPQQENPFGQAEPTQVVQPGQPPAGGGQFGDTPEPTQVVQPGKPGDAGATQVVNPVQGGGEPGADSTQLVPPGSQPPPAIPYAPPPSAADNPNAAFGHQPGGGFGAPGGFDPSQQQQHPGGFGGPPPGGPGGFGPPPGGPGGFGPPPGQGGFGPPPGGFGGPPQGGGNDSSKMISMIIAGVLALLAGLSLIVNLISVIDVATLPDPCEHLSGAALERCEGIGVDYGVGAGVIIMWVVLLLGLAGAVGGAVLIFLRKKLAQYVLLGSGGLLVVFTIVVAAMYTFAGSLIFNLFIGLLAAGAGVLGFFPATQPYIGMESGSAFGGQQGQGGGFGGPGGPGGPGGFGPP